MLRNTVMLLDPRRNNGSAYLQLLQPRVPEDLRPGIWFTKSRFPVLYEQLFRAFEAQWTQESVDPTWKPFFEVVGGQINFCLTARRPITIQGARVSLTWPSFHNGAPLQAEEYHLLEVDDATGSHVRFGYPEHFRLTKIAPSGEWGVRWSVVIDGNWREVAYTIHDVCVPAQDAS